MDSYAPVAFRASDSRGSYRERELEAFRAEVEAQDELPDTLAIEIASDKPSFRFAEVWWQHDQGVRYRVAGDDEAFVFHIAARVPELANAAADRLEARRRGDAVPEHANADKAVAPTPAERPSWLRRFLYDPWTVRVGGGLAVVVIVAAIAWVAR